MQAVDLIGAGGRTWTGTALSSRGILSPLRLPVPPLRHGPGTCADCTTPSKSVQDFLSHFWRLSTIRRFIHRDDFRPICWRLILWQKKRGCEYDASSFSGPSGLIDLPMRSIVILWLIHSNHHVISSVLLETFFIIILTEGTLFPIGHNLDPIGLYTQID